MPDDDFFLARALELAATGSQSHQGGPFGAVVVIGGRIVGEGWNRVVASKDPTAHAEVGAIRAACIALDRFHLTEATLYASSEPCPMCLAAAYWARIERIVYANPRSAAAAIGFCDDELYGELCRSDRERRIVMEHRPLPGADAVLRDWAATPGRVSY